MSFRLRALLVARDVLPSLVRRKVWPQFWRQYWRGFWKREARKLASIGQGDTALQGSERTVLTEAVAASFPFQRVLEVGCGYGQNLHVLGPLFPRSEFEGIDSREQIVTEANELLIRSGIKNAFARTAVLGELVNFPDKSYDVVMSCACLLYVPGDKILSAVDDMVRLAKNEVFLLEQHAENKNNSNQDLGVYVPGEGASGYWLRDYRKLFCRFVDEAKITISKVPHPLWKTERWSECAALIKISLR